MQHREHTDLLTRLHQNHSNTIEKQSQHSAYNLKKQCLESADALEKLQLDHIETLEKLRQQFTGDLERERLDCTDTLEKQQQIHANILEKQCLESTNDFEREHLENIAIIEKQREDHNEIIEKLRKKLVSAEDALLKSETLSSSRLTDNRQLHNEIEEVSNHLRQQLALDVGLRLEAKAFANQLSSTNFDLLSIEVEVTRLKVDDILNELGHTNNRWCSNSSLDQNSQLFIIEFQILI